MDAPPVLDRLQQRCLDEILREVNALRGDLPNDLALLEVQRINAADVNIAQFALVSETAPYHELDKAARALRDDLARLPGVKKAEVWGYPRREARVSLDVGRLAELGIPLTRVLQAVGGESLNIPGGSADAGAPRTVRGLPGDGAGLLLPTRDRRAAAAVVAPRSRVSRGASGRSRARGHGGGGRIRTLGALRHSGFQNRRIRPLCHASGWGRA